MKLEREIHYFKEIPAYDQDMMFVANLHELAVGLGKIKNNEMKLASTIITAIANILSDITLNGEKIHTKNNEWDGIGLE